MSSATVTPSLVTLGEPQPLSSTAFRPRGPSVLRTARANFETPANNGCRASSSNTICFATFKSLLVAYRKQTPRPHLAADGQDSSNESNPCAAGGSNWRKSLL